MISYPDHLMNSMTGTVPDPKATNHKNLSAKGVLAPSLLYIHCSKSISFLSTQICNYTTVHLEHTVFSFFLVVLNNHTVNPQFNEFWI